MPLISAGMKSLLFELTYVVINTPFYFPMRKIYLAAVLGLLFSSCLVHPKMAFDARKTPPAPNYAALDNWAAHPDKKDPADQTPTPDLLDKQATAQVDVFFLYPTTYIGSKRYEKQWNAAVDDAKLNKKTDESAILFQASIFNGAGRVFSPRYRQAHLHVFYGKDKKSNQQALDTAYTDIKAAFKYYLEHENKGRPFIIAGHSQGARHAMFLLRDLVENRDLQKKLVGAYIVGWPVPNDFFTKLPPCEMPDQTDCFCTWRTWEKKYGRKRADQPEIVCTNPLNWTTEPGKYVPKAANLGGVVRPFTVVRPAIVDAEVCKGILLCNKPKFPGSILFRRKNYHIGDFNLYYMNVRENADARAKAFLQK